MYGVFSNTTGGAVETSVAEYNPIRIGLYAPSPQCGLLIGVGPGLPNTSHTATVSLVTDNGGPGSPLPKKLTILNITYVFCSVTM